MPQVNEGAIYATSADVEAFQASAKPIHTRAVRERVLGAGVDLVESIGLARALADLRLENVIRTAEAPRSTVYRIWRTKDQYLADLLVVIARRSADRLSEIGTIELLRGLVKTEALTHQDGLSTRQRVVEILRQSAEQNYYAVMDSVSWQNFILLSAASVGSLPKPVGRRIERELLEGSAKFVREMSAYYELLVRSLGYKMKAEYKNNYELFAVLCASMIEGLALRHISNPSVTDNYFSGPAASDQTSDDWSVAALGLLALFDQFFVEGPYSVEFPRQGEASGAHATTHLSARELEVLRCIAKGHSNREVAQQLGIAEGTVKRHANAVYGKLEALSRIDAVNKARRCGCLS
ncbi:response regulator transcription factor [Herbiconiux liangxiaofengii]|uniref:response regulator transcription factor n=1 Tax=Herbiconiux liangxiaofengii TaxID=3342795 RepID=UPI0035B6D87D